MERLPPLKVHWEMKPLSSGKTEINNLKGGKLELKIRHDTIRGVTPEMLVWWFTNFPQMKNYGYRGTNIFVYRLWHPIDHINVEIKKASAIGAGFNKGAKAIITEALGADVETVHGQIIEMDETGLTMYIRKGPFIVARLRHNFTSTPEGTIYETRLVIGTNTLLLKGLFNKAIKKKKFTLEKCNAWIKHNIEEVGNFQYFLPELYLQLHK